MSLPMWLFQLFPPAFLIFNTGCRCLPTVAPLWRLRRVHITEGWRQMSTPRKGHILANQLRVQQTLGKMASAKRTGVTTGDSTAAEHRWCRHRRNWQGDGTGDNWPLCHSSSVVCHLGAYSLAVCVLFSVRSCLGLPISSKLESRC